MKYRLYVDETGNHDMHHVEDPNQRFLGLVGVAVSVQEVRDHLGPRLEELKRRHFPYDPDDPPVLHRKELVNRRHPFHTLRDPAVEAAFNADLLSLLEDIEFQVIAVVIDKREHRDRYVTWRFEPYHYCMTVMLERYVFLLEARGATGDAIAESRGGVEDRKLKDSYTRLFESGTDFVESRRFQAALTSRQLKVKPKRDNIAGLQVADVLAHPTRRDILLRNGLAAPEAAVFGGRIIEVLERRRYYRSAAGRIDGYGRKLLP